MQVKLLPGKMKSGKACSQAQHIFLATARENALETNAELKRKVAEGDTAIHANEAHCVTEEDREDQAEGVRRRLEAEEKLIKELRTDEMVMTMLAGVKVSMSAAQIQKQKAQAKAAAKLKNKATQKAAAAAKTKKADNQPAYVTENKKKQKKKKKK